jgi:hypothetical protein
MISRCPSRRHTVMKLMPQVSKRARDMEAEEVRQSRGFDFSTLQTLFLLYVIPWLVRLARSNGILRHFVRFLAPKLCVIHSQSVWIMDPCSYRTRCCRSVHCPMRYYPRSSKTVMLRGRWCCQAGQVIPAAFSYMRGCDKLPRGEIYGSKNICMIFVQVQA